MSRDPSQLGSPSGRTGALTRPPFRYQPTMSTDYHPAASSSSSSSSSSTQEKQPIVDDISLDEKAPQHHLPPSRGRQGHARTTSRDDPHWLSNGNAETRSRTGSGDHRRPPSLPRISTRSAYLPSPHRYHSHPPPPTFAIQRQGLPSEGTSTCCGISMSSRAKACVPFGAWIVTSLAFVVAIGWFKEEVFLGLEELSDWIRQEGYYGQAILFALIFITTFPPMPLYSTLIVLSGYCLGALQGAILSYFAALTGAMTVFVLSRTYLRSYLAEMVSSAPSSVKRAIRAVEKQPKLLFLIRLSPYPYNLMNALLATSRISFTTYSGCTALSLLKVYVHTTIGASIHKFSDYHTHSHDQTNDGDTTESGNDEGDGDDWGRIFSIFGVVLCVVVLAYISWVARKAVNEVDDDEEIRRNSNDAEQGESVAFLSPMAQDDSRRPSFDYGRLGGQTTLDLSMSESPFRASVPLPRSSSQSYLPNHS